MLEWFSVLEATSGIVKDQIVQIQEEIIDE